LLFYDAPETVVKATKNCCTKSGLLIGLLTARDEKTVVIGHKVGAKILIIKR
jgi:hypothetical protein